MKNLDLISKRILVISLSISVVLLCVSLLIFAANAKPANAQTPSFSSRMDDGRRYEALVGTSVNGYLWYFIWNTQTGTYKSNTCSNGTNLEDTYW